MATLKTFPSPRLMPPSMVQTIPVEQLLAPTQPDVSHRNKSNPELGDTLQNQVLIHTNAAISSSMLWSLLTL